MEHFQVDFMAQAPLQVSHSGGSDVYLSGYKTVYPVDFGDDDGHDGDYFGTDEDEDDESDSDDDEVGSAPRVRVCGPIGLEGQGTRHQSSCKLKGAELWSIRAVERCVVHKER